MIIVNNSYRSEQHVHNMATIIDNEGFDLDNQAGMQALKKVTWTFILENMTVCGTLAVYYVCEL